MPRRGLCRCGNVLQFTAGAHGYKMRCPSCGSVVRLRPDASNTPDGALARQKSGVLALNPPAYADPEPPCTDTPHDPSVSYNEEAIQPGELPVVELVPLSELMAAPRPSFWRRWWLPLTVVVVVAATVGVVIACR